VKWLDGAWLAEDAVVARAAAPAPLETMAAVRGELPLWPRHAARLSASLQHLGLHASLPDVPAIARELLARNGHDAGIVRVSLVREGERLRWLVTSRPRSHHPCVTLLPCVARRPSDGPPADHKCEPRAFYDAVLAEARAGGADDGIVVGDDGALLETAVGNLWLCCDEVWVTPPLDGRVLPGIARGLVLERAAAHGVPVAERRCSLSDLHRAKALMVTNAVHGPRAAHLPGQTVQELDTRLAHLWRSSVSD
jgi:branched-subunit amino acid aminotransferase/4-amino-4-deoxychorismate lyase